MSERKHIKLPYTLSEAQAAKLLRVPELRLAAWRHCGIAPPYIYPQRTIKTNNVATTVRSGSALYNRRKVLEFKAQDQYERNIKGRAKVGKRE